MVLYFTWPWAVIFIYVLIQVQVLYTTRTAAKTDYNFFTTLSMILSMFLCKYVQHEVIAGMVLLCAEVPGN